MSYRLLWLALLSWYAAPVHAHDWGEVRTPAPGPPRVIGSSSAACLAGAAQLLPEGTGYQAVDLSRRRYYGHPELVAYLASLGARSHAAGLGMLLIGDMAQPRGGPMSSGHVSHQGGLDVDVWFRLDVPPLPRDAREGLAELSFVDAQSGRVDPQRWTDAHAELVHLAATDPRVARIFVDAAIKRDLCDRTWSDRSWLRLVRPWPQHDDHMHVRLHCPRSSSECVEQPPLPPGEGCSTIAHPPARRVRRVPRTVLPPACRALIAI